MGVQNVGGTIYFKAGGKSYSAEGDVTVNLTGVESEERVAADGTVYRVERKVARRIAGTFYFDQEINPETLSPENMTDVTVKVEIGNGKVGTLNEAFQKLPIDVSTANGTFPLEFVGQSGKWT